MTRSEWAKRKGRSSSFVSKATRFAIYARDNFDCVYCRGVFPPPMDGKGLTLDHVIPRSQGGDNSPGNLVTACPKCNSTRQCRPLAKLRHFCIWTPDGSKRTSARVRRQLKKPLNRQLGQWLSRFAKRERAKQGPTRAQLEQMYPPGYSCCSFAGCSECM